MSKDTILFLFILLTLSTSGACSNNTAIVDEIERVTNESFSEDNIVFREKNDSLVILIYQTSKTFYLLQHDNKEIISQKDFSFSYIDNNDSFVWNYNVPAPEEARPNILWGAVKKGEKVPIKIKNNHDVELKFIETDQYILFYYISDIELNKPILEFEEFKQFDG
ncbi:hypothetical protein [Bacillus sp. FJAT-45350]|uniref:hypothetical protein n=1 Tax=Bacillus sp. FJAT-45350 TaxID=2011014 RepID=UPI000BB8F3DF|nr:hypothetical protein [Bacillus sp. FJAT-45350]